ncbi:MAG TPA: hypothetical protein VGM23_18070 [Armatimonadota bacterium]
MFHRLLTAIMLVSALLTGVLAAPDWVAQRKAALYQGLLADPQGADHYRILPLLDSGDPALIQRANAGLRNVKLAGSWQGLVFLMAMKKFPDRLEPVTKEHIRAQLTKELSDDNGWAFPWTGFLNHADQLTAPYGNMAYHAAMMGIVGGEILGKPAVFTAGRTLLRNLVREGNHTGDEGEFNSLGYTTFSMVMAAEIAELADDAECRALARWQRDRLMLLTLSRYHAPSNQVCGPYSRGYNDEHLGYGCTTNLLLNDTIIPGGVFADAVNGQKYHGGYPYPTQQTDALITWNIPDYLRRLALEKPQPFELDSTVYDRGWNWRGPDGVKIIRLLKPGPRDLTTYLTPAYALATSSGPYQYQYAGSYCSAYWAVASKISSPADLHILWSELAYDDKGPFADGIFGRRQEMFRAVQLRNKALVMTYPLDQGKPITTETVKMEIVCSAYRPLEELYVGAQRVDLAKLPVTFPTVQPLFLRDGPVYAAVLPLEITNLGREVAMRVNVDAHKLLTVSYYNYQGAAKEFQPAELRKISSGYAIEIAAKGDYPDFAAFRAHLATARVTDAFQDDEREATFTSGADRLRLRYNPVTETEIAREINGKPAGPYVGLRSPCAVLAPGGTATLGKAQLDWAPKTVQLWLVKDPRADDYAVWNLSGEQVTLTVTTPAGQVQATDFGNGRLFLHGGAAPTLEVEELPGAKARITATTGNGKAIPVTRR